MLSFKNILIAITLSIASTMMVACNDLSSDKQTQTDTKAIGTAVEGNLATTPVTEPVYDNASAEDFIVRPAIDMDGLFPGLVQIQYRGDSNVHITSVEVNRGNCATAQAHYLPVTLGFGNTLQLPLVGCDFTQLLEVTVVTTEHTYTYVF